jgi:DNA-binding phage protein
MKYEIERCKKENFKPFKITITIETEEDFVHFHDNVMDHITKTHVHDFHGHVYRCGNGEIDSAKGEI